MLHIKKMYLIILFIFIGISIYKYYNSQKIYYTKQTGKVAEYPMNTTQKTGAKTGTEITTPSGLRYTILQHGADDAKVIASGDIAVVHYTGFLENNGELGKKFDSSVDRGEPFSFVIDAGMVIAGWDEGVRGMRIGEQRRLIIPSKLGYGSRGIPGTIPGNATLIFDVELLDIES